MKGDKRMPKLKSETKEGRSFVMSRVRSTGNASTELRFIALMKAALKDRGGSANATVNQLLERLRDV